MKINRIEIENFKPYRKVVLPPEGKLPEGLFIVQGPNSTGKTSLVEAVLWALWGPRAIPGVKQEQLIKKGESSCQVTLDFEVEDVEYQIRRRYTRGAGPSVILLRRANGKLVPVEKGATQVENELNRILGVTYQEALDTLFIRQGEVDKLATARPGELRDLIRDLFGLKKLEHISDILSEKAKNAEKEIQQLERETVLIKEKERQIEELKEELRRLEQQKSKIMKTIKELEEELQRIPETRILKNLKDLNSEIEKTRVEAESITQQMEIREKTRKDLEEEIDNLKSQLEKAAEEADKLKDEEEKMPSSEIIKKLRNNINIAEQHLKNKEQIEDEIIKDVAKIDLPFNPLKETEKIAAFTSELKSRHRETERKNKEIAEKVKSLLRSIGALEGQWRELDGNIKTLKGQRECPTCLRPLTGENMNEVMNRIRSKIREIKQNIKKLGEEREKTEKEQENTLNQLKQIEEQLDNLKSIQEKCERYSSEGKKADTAFQKALETLKEIGYSKIEEMLSSLNVKDLDELLEKKGKVTGQLKEKEREIGNLKEKIRKTEKRLTDEQKQIKKLKEKLHKLNIKLNDAKEKFSQILQSLQTESLETFLEKFRKKTLDDLITQREILETELKGRKEKLGEIEDQIKGKKDKNQKIINELKELYEKLKLLKEKRKEHAHIEQLRILMDDFISEHVVRNRLCGALKTATTNYLTYFSAGRYTLLDIDAPTRGPYGAGVTITLKDHVDELEKTRELLSGGDKACLGLALRMAISNLMSRIRPFKSERLKRPKVRCLIMDEPLGGLDSKRRPEVVRTLINDKTFTQIFLITHTNLLLSDEELSSAHRITVHQEAGTSRISFQPAKTA